PQAGGGAVRRCHGFGRGGERDCDEHVHGQRFVVGVKFKSQTFSVPQAATLTITLDWTDSSANLNEFLYDPTGTQVASAATTNHKPEVITFQATTTGTWKVGVSAASGTSSYTVTVDQSPPAVAPTPPSYAATVGGAGHAEMYPS